MQWPVLVTRAHLYSGSLHSHPRPWRLVASHPIQCLPGSGEREIGLLTVFESGVIEALEEAAGESPLVFFLAWSITVTSKDTSLLNTDDCIVSGSDFGPRFLSESLLCPSPKSLGSSMRILGHQFRPSGT